MRYHPRILARPLKRHGFMAQRPTAQAKERGDTLVRDWVKHDWELIKKGSPPAPGDCLRG